MQYSNYAASINNSASTITSINTSNLAGAFVSTILTLKTNLKTHIATLYNSAENISSLLYKWAETVECDQENMSNIYDKALQISQSISRYKVLSIETYNNQDEITKSFTLNYDNMIEEAQHSLNDYRRQAQTLECDHASEENAINNAISSAMAGLSQYSTQLFSGEAIASAVVGFFDDTRNEQSALKYLHNEGIDIFKIEKSLAYATDTRKRLRVYADGKPLYDFKSNKYFKTGKKLKEKTGYDIAKASFAFTGKGKFNIKAMHNAGKEAFTDSLNIISDFRCWEGVSKLTKASKSLGIAGTAITIGSDIYDNFAGGNTTFSAAHKIANTAGDVGVDMAVGASAAYVGASVGSLIVPPVGTVVGAAAGGALGVLSTLQVPGVDKSVTDIAKDGVHHITSFLFRE
ncbi:hypothetical protein ACFQY8_00265 [Alloscardovia venturai]|uniref:LXG domain-containing protein n=1 Tax=Alloscardovia venturai TaxID=1769421 RepID=A0ABW2Y819_9BIFI